MKSKKKSSQAHHRKDTPAKRQQNRIPDTPVPPLAELTGSTTGAQLDIPFFYYNAAEIGVVIELCLRGKALPRARILCEHLLSRAPDNEANRYLAAKLELADGQPEKALSHICFCLDRTPAAMHHELHGEILLAMGNKKEAAKAFEEAIRLNPNRLQSAVKLGRLERESGNLEKALALLTDAVGKNPEDTDAVTELAITLNRSGRHGEARQRAEAVLAREPKNETALEVVYHANIASGDTQAAIDRARALIALQPANGRYYNFLSSALSESGQVDAAIEEIRRATQLDPDDFGSLRFLAILLMAQGKWDDQRVFKLIDRALELAPGNVETLAAKADILERRGDHENAFKIARELCPPDATSLHIRSLRVYLRYAPKFHEEETAKNFLDRFLPAVPTMQVPIASSLLFGAGEFYDRLGEYDKAFECFEKANTLKPRVYNPAIIERVVNRAIGAYTCEAVAKSPKAHPRPHATPLFVVGMPRSGTSLTEKILTCHPEVYGAGELGTIEGMAGNLMNVLQTKIAYPENVFLASQEIFDRLASQFMAQFTEEIRTTKRFIVDKMPANAFFVGFIHHLFPEAPIVCCRRHPLDMAFSCYSLEFSMVGLNYTFNLANIAHYYQNYQKIMEHWAKILPPGRIKFLDYEKLVQNPETEIRELLDHCGLAWHPACLEPHKSKHTSATASYEQTRKPLNTKAVGRWRNYEKYLTPFMKEFGLQEETGSDSRETA